MTHEELSRRRREIDNATRCHYVETHLPTQGLLHKPVCGASTSDGRMSMHITKVRCEACIAWILDWTVRRRAELQAGPPRISRREANRRHAQLSDDFQVAATAARRPL